MGSPNPMEIVLGVVDPAYKATTCVEKVATNKSLLMSAFRLANRNGLSYFFLYRLKELGLALELLEDNRWVKESQRLLRFKETILLLNSIAINHKIEYMLIKACNTIPHVPRDVDIFVRREERDRVIKALEDNGMKRIQSGVTETSLGGYIGKIDVYTRICYLGFDFFDAEFLWQSRMKVQDEMLGIEYPGLNGEVNFLLALVHGFFGHRAITLLDFLHIKHLKEGIQNIKVCKKYAHERGWGLALDSILADIEGIQEKIYKRGEIVQFPYLFNRCLILKCISEIRGLDIGRFDKIFLQLSLIQDGAIARLRDTRLYNFLKSFETARNSINSLTAFIKKLRGDIKSVSQQVRK